MSTPPSGTFCWSELGTSDTAGAERFYTALFGWSTADQDMGELGTYTMLRLGGRDLGGMYELKGPMFAGVPPHWMFYVAVDDVDASAASASKLGGKLIAPPMDVHEVGRMAVVEDPTGAKVALFKGTGHQGATVEPMTPGSFGRVVLQTRDTAKARQFDQSSRPSGSSMRRRPRPEPSGPR